jgi:hypothetical protein
MNKNMKRIAKWMLGIGLGMGVSSAQAANPIDGTITVTPVATVSLLLSPTTYAFGPLSVNTSSVAATAVTLSNNGSVDVLVDKNIQTESNPAGWTAATIASPAVALNKYALYVATAAARPAAGDFTDALHLFNGTGGNDLKGLGGGDPTITPSGGSLPSVELWFKLNMPSAVSAQTAREITVRFTGTAQ